MEVLTERTANIMLADYDDDNENEEKVPAAPTMGMSLKNRHMSKSNSRRRRRRSSARFLTLTPGEGEEEEDGEEGGNITGSENLGEVYQNAIRMNAENRINASNSWNLNLIDHMDRFLINNGQGNAAPVPMEDTLGPLTGVNFTKASCTLDASVKIYSYRVDDVHLTSYKVLANLNRTDNGKKAKNTAEENSQVTAESNNEGAAARQERRAARNNAETLETNLANINVHKLDAAFDIDPLFHKMSKTFDEGGAKGLLLANLSVSETGCNIVFDSTLDDEGDAGSKQSKTIHGSANQPTVDVTSLTASLDSSLNGQTVHQLPLVPQLTSLRSEFVELKNDGFVEKVKPSLRYAAPKEDEAEADRSIHVEAIERSRASQADLGRSLMAGQDDDTFMSGDDDDVGYAPIDFGGDEDSDDNNAGVAPVSLIHDGDHRFSSESFQTIFEASQPPSQASVLLDAIAAGDISGSQSNYEYFNKKALEAVQGNNQWAGAAHWKKMQPKRAKGKKLTTEETETASSSAKPTKKRKGRTNKKAGSKQSATIAVDVTNPLADMKDLLKKPPKGKKGSTPLQFTKAAVAKATKNENLLPMDAGIKVENFTSLFLRPTTNVIEFAIGQAAAGANTRQVGFGGVETWGHDDDNSYGDDGDNGCGFAFGGNDDDNDYFGNSEGEFVVPELEGVRKVDKVKVGYATIAKKVDVKRLKNDLWQELDRTFQERGVLRAISSTTNAENDGGDNAIDDPDAEQAASKEQFDEDAPTNQQQPEAPLSFQDTVRGMQSSQSQTDVTLPFYFICVLHLANEKGLELESQGLEDFVIRSS